MESKKLALEEFRKEAASQVLKKNKRKLIQAILLLSFSLVFIIFMISSSEKIIFIFGYPKEMELIITYRFIGGIVLIFFMLSLIFEDKLKIFPSRNVENIKIEIEKLATSLIKERIKSEEQKIKINERELTRLENLAKDANEDEDFLMFRDIKNLKIFLLQEKEGVAKLQEILKNVS